jgi:photosystem II stability/assembly factor-like uncharacterized protein
VLEESQATKAGKVAASMPGARRTGAARPAVWLAASAGLFLVSTLILLLQEPADPLSGSTALGRWLCPAPPAEALQRVRCSLNGVAAVAETPARGAAVHVWVVGNRGLLLHSADGGASWEQEAPGSPPQAASASWSWLPVVRAAIRREPSRREKTEKVEPGGYATTPSPTCLGTKGPDPAARCVDVVVTGIPAGARITSIAGSSAEVEAPEKWGPCPEREACAIGEARFADAPQVGDQGRSIQVRWRYMNWSRERSRLARVVVTFEAPSVPVESPPPATPSPPTPSTLAPRPSAPDVRQQTVEPPHRPSPAGLPDEDLVGVHFESATVGWIVSRSGAILESRDGGGSWQGRFAPEAPPDAARDAILFEARLRGRHLLPDGATLWERSEDGRLSIRRGAKGGSDEAGVQVPPGHGGIFFLDERRGWVVGRQGEIVSVDLARDPELVVQRARDESAADLFSVAFLPDGRRGWTVGARGTLLATVDGGARWVSLTRGGDGTGESWSPRLPRWYFLACLAALLLLVPARVSVEPAEAPERSVADILSSDRPLESERGDRLDFASLARGLSRFLRNAATRPPLTVAIVGAWGTGKSSLMNLLMADLHEYGFRPVSFNAWHHQKEEHLLAALLQSLRLQAIPSWWVPAGWEFRLRLLAIRGRRYWVPTLLALFAFTGLVGYELKHPGTVSGAVSSLLALVLPESAGPAAPGPRGSSLAVLGVAATLGIGILRLLRPFGVNPASLMASMSGAVKIRQLTEQTSFRQLFKEQFAEVTRALGPRTMPIFIDDLDRCRPTQVVELLEAVSFLVTSGECFVILGLARDQVLSSVGLSFKEVAAELAGGSQDANEARKKRGEYAREYLDKLINLEIPIAPPDEKQSRDLLLADVAPSPAPPLRRIGRFAAPVALLAATVAAGVWLGRELPGPAATAVPARPGAAPTGTVGGAPPTETTPGAGPTTGLEWPPPATAEEEPRLDPPLPRRTLALAYWPIWPLGALLLALAAWALSRRTDLVVEDSPEFQRALGIWHPIVAARCGTPRALKRFVNRLRYLAMLQRPPRPAATLGRGLLALLSRAGKRVRGRAREAPRTEPGPGGPLPEATLVALSAAEALDPRFPQEPLQMAQLREASLESAFEEARQEHTEAFGSWQDVEDARERFARLVLGVKAR